MRIESATLRPRRIQAAKIVLAILIPVSLCPSVTADQLEDLAQKSGIRILAAGESSADLQKKTAAAVPLRMMSQANRQRAEKLLATCNQYRRLPELQYTIDEPIFRYLLHHPDVAVSTWRAMGISRFEMFQTGPMEYEAHAIDGSEGIADILYQDSSQTVFICEGNYHNVLLPRPLEASALIWFRAVYTPNAEGTHVVSQKADVFVRFPSASVSTFAKMLTPVTNSMMDRNLFEVSLYASMMSRAVRDEPEWVIQMAEQLDGVLPQRKTELADVARQPRKQADKSIGGTSTTDRAADREIIMSPQLLFFDPPKQASGTPATPASGSKGRIEFIPASKARVIRSPRLSEDTESGNSRLSGDEKPTIPAAAPTGPTATGPVGAQSR